MSSSPRARTTDVRVSKGPEGDLLVYDVRADAGHVLNPSVGTVYELADGSRSVRDLAAMLPELVGLPADEEIVLLALQELDEADLLESVAPSVPHISRRQLIGRLTLAAGIVALLPALDSISGLSKASAQAKGVGTSSSTVDESGAYDDAAMV